MGFATSWGPSTSSTTTSYWVGTNITAANTYEYPKLDIKVQNATERLFEKGKFFAFESSREFRAWFSSPRKPPEVHARHGFQQMSRIPCYRGVRTR